MKKSAQARESHLRSIFKSITWRILATTTTTIIAYIITGETAMALTIGGIEFIIKMFIYYLHERIWNLVAPGTVRKIVPHKHKTD